MPESYGATEPGAIVRTMDPNASFTSVEELQTLPHSAVSRLTLGDGTAADPEASRARGIRTWPAQGEVDLAHAFAMNLPRLFGQEYEPDAWRRYARASSDAGLDRTESDVRERYRRCLMLTVIVASGMRTVQGMSELNCTFLFTNAVHSALDHDVMELLA